MNAQQNKIFSPCKWNGLETVNLSFYNEDMHKATDQCLQKLILVLGITYTKSADTQVFTLLVKYTVLVCS
jgi:hypothetical protein